MKALSHQSNHQRGAAALFVAVILLFASTLIVLYAGKVGVQDQRISGNDYRAKQAFANAEAGLERMAGKLIENKDSITFPISISSQAAEPLYITNATKAADSIIVSSTGYADAYGASNNGAAAVQQQYAYYSLFGSGPAAPFIIGGNVPLVGGMEIVGNPNGGGPGVLVSVWTKIGASATFSGSGATCAHAEYLSNGGIITTSTDTIQTCDPNSCTCNSTGLDGRKSYVDSGGTQVNGGDIVFDPEFPSNLLEYVTGYDDKTVETLEPKIQGKWGNSHILTSADCGNSGKLNANSNGVYLIKPATPGSASSCDYSGQASVGGAKTCGPSGTDLCTVVLILADVDFKTKTGIPTYGLIFSWDPLDPTYTLAGGGIQLTGAGLIYGAFVSDHSLVVSGGAGSFDIRYEREVFKSLADSDKNDDLARVAGTWIDQ